MFRSVGLLLFIVYDQLGNVKATVGRSKSRNRMRRTISKDVYSRCRSKFMLPKGLACHPLLALTDRVVNVNSQ